MSCLLLVIAVLVAFQVFVECKIKGKNDFEVNGVVLLDDVTFPLVVPSERTIIMTCFVQKTTMGRDTEADVAREEFLEFANVAFEEKSENLLLSQVLINGAHNKRLAIRNGIDVKNKMPQVVLFMKGDPNPIKYPYKAISKGMLKRFASKYTNFYAPSELTLPEFDKMAITFRMNDNAKEKQSEIMKKTEELYLNHQDAEPDVREKMEFYLKLMRHISEKGFKHVAHEIERLEGILSSGSLEDRARLSMIAAKIDIALLFDKEIQFVNPPEIAPSEIGMSAVDVKKLQEEIKADLA